MTATAARSLGSRRSAAVILGVALLGTMFVPAVVHAAGPFVTISTAEGQLSPTNTAPIRLIVTFSDPVEGFTGGDVAIYGDAGGTKTATVTGGPNTYNVAITGMTTMGTVYAYVPEGVARNPADEPNSRSNTHPGIGWTPGPSVSVLPAPGQATTTGTSPVNFSVVFSDPVQGFTSADVVIGGAAGGTKTATVTGGPTSYNVAVTGMTTSGNLTVAVPAGAATNSAGNPNFYSNFGTVNWSTVGPSVTINQAAGQADPTGNSPINFAVTFSSPVADFATGDVAIGGTAGGTKTALVTGSGTTYNVAVSGMTTAGTVIATVPASVAVDAAGRANLASTSIDTTVTWTAVASTITLTTSAPIPPGAQSPVILWGQGFTLGVQFATNGANRPFELQGTRDEITWTTITSLTTDVNGGASFLYRPVTNLFYRAVFAGSTDLAAGTSNQVRTVVRELAVMRPTNAGAVKSIDLDDAITFTTTVRPSRPELAPATVSFSFYRQVSGAWQLATKRDVLVDSTGLARTTFEFSSAGEWYVRSQANPTPYNANSVLTPVERYSVG